MTQKPKNNLQAEDICNDSKDLMPSKQESSDTAPAKGLSREDLFIRYLFKYGGNKPKTILPAEHQPYPEHKKSRNSGRIYGLRLSTFKKMISYAGRHLRRLNNDTKNRRSRNFTGAQ